MNQMNQKQMTGQQKFFILIVDDVPKNLQILGNLLNSKGYHFSAAASGKQALKVIEKRPPDLILLDIMMPEMNGFEVCRLLKSKDDTKDIPIIFISALTDTSDKLKAFEAGGVDYITKPFQKQEVFARIQTHLKLKQSNRELKRINETLNTEVRERQKAENALRGANSNLSDRIRQITDSIRYARLIQNSVLSPNLTNIDACIPDSFVIMMPKDVVSGDLIFSDFFEDSMVIAVIDCTGHGVPGAFMTMIAFSGLKKIIREEGCRDPAEILSKLNFFVKTTLCQDTEDALSDDGLDASVSFIKPKEKLLIFAGARLPMICIRNGKANFIKGDKQSIGYKRSDLNFNFTNHIIKIEEEMLFYMLTDGFLDQLGGKRRRRFGRKHFINLLEENREKSFDEQQEILLRAFNEHKGENERQDDVTVIGFRL